jgi:integrase
MEDARQRQKQGYALLDEHLTVRAYLEDWLKRAPSSHSLEATTSVRYNNLLRPDVIEHAGNESLVKFAASAPRLRALYNQLSTKPQPTTGKSLASSTVHLVHVVLHPALVDAFNDELIACNVTDTVKPAPVKRKKKYLTPVEAKKLPKQAEQEGGRFDMLYWVELNTGARLDELLSLTWQDVLWEQGKSETARLIWTRAAPTSARGDAMALSAGTNDTSHADPTSAHHPTTALKCL